MPDSVFFDLDNTLIAGDSDYLWGEYLADQGAVPAQEHRARNQYFLNQYQYGQLDAEEFLAFQLYPLSLHSMPQLIEWRDDFLRKVIVPLLLPKAIELVNEHRACGRQLILATSTNSFLTRPIAQRFRIEHLIAAEPQILQGRFTGAVDGRASFGPAKLEQAQSWLSTHGGTLETSWFYSDSHTDLPLLHAVKNPIVVDGDKQLLDEARYMGWAILSLR